MKPAEQQTMKQPDLDRSNMEGNDNFNSPSFAPAVVEITQQLMDVSSRMVDESSPIRKPYALHYTSSATCTSTDAYSTCSESASPIIRLTRQKDPRCDHHQEIDNSAEVEYSLEDFFQCNLNGQEKEEDLSGDEAVIEELDEESSDDEFAQYLYDEEEDDSVLSLNTLIKHEDEFIVAEACKDATKMGCLGFVHFGLSGVREQEDVLNQNCYGNGRNSVQEPPSTQVGNASYGPLQNESSGPVYEVLVINENSLFGGSNDDDEESNTSVGDASCSPCEPDGEKFVSTEISFTKDARSTTSNRSKGADSSDIEPAASDLSHYVHDDDDDDVDDRDKLESLGVVLATDKDSISSDWSDDNDSKAASDAGTSVYMESSSQAPEDGESLLLTTELSFGNDEDQPEQDKSDGAQQIEPDGIKMRSQIYETIEIQGVSLDANGLQSTENELEVLHLEEPPYEILEV